MKDQTFISLMQNIPKQPHRWIHFSYLNTNQTTHLTILENSFQCLIQMLLISIAIPRNIIPDLITYIISFGQKTKEPSIECIKCWYKRSSLIYSWTQQISQHFENLELTTKSKGVDNISSTFNLVFQWYWFSSTHFLIRILFPSPHRRPILLWVSTWRNHRNMSNCKHLNTDWIIRDNNEHRITGPLHSKVFEGWCNKFTTPYINPYNINFLKPPHIHVKNEPIQRNYLRKDWGGTCFP